MDWRQLLAHISISRHSFQGSLATPWPYKAFISYSHAADDRLAQLLQSALHRFAKPWYRRRALRVFRDKSSLAANPALWPAIEASLSQSEWLLLMASHQSAESRWVQEEVGWWITHRSADRLLILLTDGDILWDRAGRDFDWSRTTAVSSALTGRFPDEPLYVDLRWAKTLPDLSLRHSQFRAAVLDIAAPLHERPKDELDGEDVRQHRRTRQVTAAAVTVIALFAGLATWQWFEARRQRDEAIRQREIAFARELAAQSELARVQDARLLPRSVLLAVESMRRFPSLEGDTVLRRGLALLPRPLAQFSHPGPVLSMALSPDGRRLATVVEGGSTVQLRDVLSRHTVRDIAHEAVVRTVLFAPGGESLLTASGQTVQVWTATSGEAAAPKLEHPFAPESLTLSPDGRYLAVLGRDTADRLVSGLVRVWDLTTAQPIPELDGSEKLQLVFAPIGSRLAIVGAGVRVFDLAAGRELVFIKASTLIQAVFRPDGTHLATVGNDKVVRVWSIDEGGREVASKIFPYHIRSLAYSPDGRILAAAVEEDPNGYLWAPGRKEAFEKIAHPVPVTHVAFHPHGRLLATIARDDSVRLWDLKTASEVVRMTHDAPVTVVALSRAGDLVASASIDGTVRVWTPDNAHAVTLPAAPDLASLVLERAGGGEVLTACHGNVRERWDVVTGRRDAITDVRCVPARGVRISDGRLFVPGPGPEVHILDSAGERELARIPQGDGVQWLRLSPDGKSLATGDH
jgi:WD40 repeat protein